MIKYIGIDLGQKGAVAVQSWLGFNKPTHEVYPFWDRFGGRCLRTITDPEMVDLFRNILENSGEAFVAIEHPVFMPTNGKKAIAGMFEKFGLIKGILMSMGVDSVWLPKPVQWKKVVTAPGSDKSKMLSLASRLTKHSNLNVLTADSVLICEACRLYYR